MLHLHKRGEKSIIWMDRPFWTVMGNPLGFNGTNSPLRHGCHRFATTVLNARRNWAFAFKRLQRWGLTVNIPNTPARKMLASDAQRSAHHERMPDTKAAQSVGRDPCHVSGWQPGQWYLPVLSVCCHLSSFLFTALKNTSNSRFGIVTQRSCQNIKTQTSFEVSKAH